MKGNIKGARKVSRNNNCGTFCEKGRARYVFETAAEMPRLESRKGKRVGDSIIIDEFKIVQSHRGCIERAFIRLLSF